MIIDIEVQTDKLRYWDLHIFVAPVDTVHAPREAPEQGDDFRRMTPVINLRVVLAQVRRQAMLLNQGDMFSGAEHE